MSSSTLYGQEQQTDKDADGRNVTLSFDIGRAGLETQDEVAHCSEQQWKSHTVYCRQPEENPLPGPFSILVGSPYAG